MAIPGEKEHLEYLKYVEEWSLGEHEGPKMTKEQWREKRNPKPTPTPKPENKTLRGTSLR